MKTRLTLTLLFLSIGLPFIAFGQTPKKDPVKLKEYQEARASMERHTNKLYIVFGKRADKDNDKHLTLQELRDFCEAEMEPHETNKNCLAIRILKKKNPKLDMNNDGLLTKPELIKYMDECIWYTTKQEGE